ncbi:MAG: DNA polymerase I [Clostridia bacterium]|nr:DNA polymerase I [Clostridia bacterium]
MKKLLVVDGNSILNRAFYGVRMLSTRDGLCTNAVYGMITMLMRHLEMSMPDGCAIAFDRKAPTFRHQRYAEYKANRKGMPEELAMQLSYAKEAAALLGFHVIELDGYEADDILGTLSARASALGIDCDILTGDRDSLQLIHESGADRGAVRVLLTTNADTQIFDEAAFAEKYGVRADQFVDVKALMGDASDNIPGVPGIGEKTALKLIAQFGSLDALYAALPEADLTKSVKTKLEAGQDSALLSRELAQICCDAPVECSIDALAYSGMDRAGCLALFEKLEFHALIKRFSLEEESKRARTPCRAVDASPEALLALPPDKPIALSLSADHQCLLAFDGACLLQLTIADVPSGFFADTSRCIVCYDSKTMRRVLAARGKDFVYCAHDVMLAAYVLNSADSYGLPRLVNYYLDENYDETISAAEYVFALYPVLDAKLREADEARLMYEIELPTARVLADMEMRGFKIDREGLRRFGDMLAQHEAEYAERIYTLAGKTFNINSPKQLGEVLFDYLGLPASKKTKTGYSTNAEVLENLRPFHPIVGDILDYRQVAKLRATYADGLLRMADADGRIHTSFNQTGTATGRLSSAEPNLQNIPIRTALGREMRRFFVAENEDYLLLDADYSQIELRLLADISGDETMIAAFADGEDIHTSTACTVFGVTPEGVTTELRKRAKAVNFGIVYGIGDFSLAQDLGIPRAQAKRYIENYLAAYPGISAYLKNIVAEAYAQGYVTTIFGRRRFIDELSGQNKHLRSFGERVAMNSPIQGSAADIIKIAMVRVDERLRALGLDAHLILQVHDELIVEAHRDCADEALAVLREEMEHAVSLKVPLDVDAKMGTTWYDCK